MGFPFQGIENITAHDIAFAALARQERTKEITQILAWIAYNGAALTGIAVNDPRKFPRLEDAFPNLFERKLQQDWRVMKERIDAYSRNMDRFD